MDQARLAAQRECTELRHQALQEIKAVLGKVDSIQVATNEELETQRIFTNIARIKATPASVMAQPNQDSDGTAPSRDRQSQDGALEMVAETLSQTEPIPVATAAPTESSSNSPARPSEPAEIKGSAHKDNPTKGKRRKA